MGHEDLIVWLMVAVEALILIAGATWLCRRLSPALPLWTAIGGGVLLASGTIASADIARWFHPFYGNVYNFAYAAGFTTIAATLDRRMLLAGIAVGVAAAFHPIIGLFFGCAAGAVVLVRLRDYSFFGLLGGAVAALAVFAFWYMLAISGANISGGIDGALFTDLTRLMSSHWFPVSGGVFGNRAWETLLPALALMLLLAATVRTSDPRTGTSDRQILSAVALLAAVTLVGVVVSIASTNPLLIKLALHRASLIGLLLAAAIAVPRLLDMAARGPLLLALIAGGPLLVPYWRGHGVPLLAALVLVGGTVFFLRSELSRLDRIVIAVACAVAIVTVATLTATGNGWAVAIDTLSGLSLLRSPWFALAGVLTITARLLKAPALIAAAMAVGVWVWLPQVDAMGDPQLRQRAAHLQEAQVWAKANTQPTDLFMLDPTMSYGWRQYSERPSFGILREWLYSGWLYDTDPAIMAEGLRRARLLGLDLSTYTEMAKTDSTSAYDRLIADAARLFYARDAAALSATARENGVAFVVMDKAKASPSLPQLPVVYENPDFAILKP